MQLRYQGALQGEYGSPMQVAALLTDGSGAPIAGAAIQFAILGQVLVVATDADGQARGELVPGTTASSAVLTATFAGDATHDAVETTTTVSVARADSVVRYVGPLFFDTSSATTVNATLRRHDGTPLAGRTLSFQAGAASATATTVASGHATATIPAGAAPSTATVSFAGDAVFTASSDTLAVISFQRSGFVIWGGNPGGIGLGAHVNFWGEQWAAQVIAGDYASNPSFKGYIAQLAGPGLCEPTATSTGTPRLDASCWTTKPGNSSPPLTLAPVIGVVVSTSIAKSDPSIYGNIAGYALVRVDQPSTYDPAPGHEGWGTVIAFVSGGPGMPILSASQSQAASLLPGQSYPVSVDVTNGGTATASNVRLNEGADLILLGSIAAAGTAHATVIRTAPSVPARATQETSADYAARLGAADGQLVGNFGTLSSQDTSASVQPQVDVFSSSRLTLPRLTIQIDAPGCAGPGETATWTVTLRNVGSASTTSVQAVVELPDGTQRTLAFDSMPPGAVAQRTTSWVVPVPAPLSAGESASDYLRRLHSADGSRLRATARATWIDALGSLYGSIDAQAETIERLPALIVAAESLPTLLPGQSGTLRLDVLNQGTGDAFAVSAGLQGEAGSAPTSLAPGATATLTVPVRAPADAPDGAPVSFPYFLRWQDSSSNPYGPLTAVASSTAVRPSLSATLTAPPAAFPGDSLTYTLAVHNGGHADAAGATVRLVLPDGSISTSPIGSVPAGGDATVASSWTVPVPAGRGQAESNEAYLSRLHAADGASLRVSATLVYADANANSYSATAPDVQTVERLAILRATPSSIPDKLLPGQSSTLTISIANEGSAAASQSTVSIAGTAVTTGALAPGASTALAGSITAPPAPGRNPGEVDAAYLARLSQANGTSLSFGWSASWHGGNSDFGSLTGVATSREVLPVLSLSTTLPPVASPGSALIASVVVYNAGGADARGVSATLRSPDGITITLPIDDVARSAQASASREYQVPLVPARLAGESSADYIARLGRTNGAPLGFQAVLSWHDGQGNSYGALTTDASAIELLPVVTVQPQALAAPVLPASSTPIDFTLSNSGGASATASVHAAGSSSSAAVDAGSSASVSITVPVAALAAKGAAESDVAYSSRLLEAESTPAVVPFTAGWVDSGSHSYGPTEGTVQVPLAVPVLSIALSAPASTNSGDTVSYTALVHDAGHAAGQNAVVVFSMPDGTTVSRTIPAVGSGADATASASYVIPTSQPSGVVTAHATVSWQDANGNPYGTLSASTTTQVNGVAPLVHTAVTPASLPTVSPGDTLPFTLTQSNDGTDTALHVRVGVANDMVSGSSPPALVPNWFASGILPYDLAAGTAATRQTSFALAPLAPRGAQETASAYVNRLFAAQQGTARFGFFTAWDDALGRSYGPVSTQITAPVRLPIFSPGAPGISVQAGIPVTVDMAFLTNQGGALAASATVSANTHDGSFPTVTTGPIPAGTTVRATKLWTPAAPSPRTAAETSDQYVARLNQYGGLHQEPAQATWTTSGGAVFGPVDYIWYVSMSVPIISLNNPLPPRFPGEQVVLSFYTPLPVTNLVPKLTLPDGRVLTGTLGSISGSQQNFGFPNIGAIPDPKGATETDVDYVARLQQFQQVVRSYPWSATWTDVANNPYGAIDGVLSGKVLIPIVVPSITCPQQANAGQTVACTVRMQNVGTDTAFVEVTALYPDGTEQFIRADPTFGLVVVSPGSTGSLSYTYTIPSDQPSSWMDLGARVRWQGAGAQQFWYGPSTATTRMHVGANLPPFADAGRSQTVQVAAGADLHGTVSDDGLLFTHPLTSTWTQVSGPGWVKFLDRSNPITHADFTEPGDYFLQLAADDGQYVTNSRVTILVRTSDPDQNHAPTVSAGPPQTVSLTAVAPTPIEPKLVGTYPGANTLAAHEAVGGLLVSVNTPFGEPYNLALLQPDGTMTQFSSLHGVTGELPIAVAESDQGGMFSIGGFAAGTVFTTNESPGAIVRISPDGSQMDNPWLRLPGETSFLAGGGLLVDRTGVFGGDLVALTQSGSLWRINSAGVANRVFALNLGPAFGSAPVEDMEIFPNDPAHYGPFAGKLIITQHPFSSAIWKVNPSGAVSSVNWGQITPLSLRGAENIRAVLPNENLFSVRIQTENGTIRTQTLFVIPASGMLSMAGDIVLTTEDQNDTIHQQVGSLYRLHWTGTQFQVNEISVPFLPTAAFEGLAFARAGAAREPILTTTLQLAGSVTDDGLPKPARLVSTWTELSGPGAVTFADAHNPQTTATFSDPGKYVLRLTATDGQLTASSDVSVFINPADQAPVVNAGGDQSIPVGAVATLSGSATDDGIPVGATLMYTWSKAGGTGDVAFSSPHSPQTTASFSAPGKYQLRLSVSDSQMVGTSDLMVTVRPPNSPPIADAGPEQTIVLPSLTARLAGVASDDGLPNGHVTSTWSQVSGPTPATFSDVHFVNSLVTVSQAGDYLFRLTVSDDELSASDTVTFHFVSPSAINRAPVVSAGAAGVVGNFSMQLAGAAADDGLPAGSILTTLWTQVSGPPVIVSDPHQLDALVTFPGGGNYVLRLTASDGALSSHADVQILVLADPAANQPPSVRIAGPTRIPVTGGPVQFVGSATDDGFPAGVLTYSWTTVSGPAVAVFESPSAPSSLAHFTAPGDYVIRLAVSDGELTSGADLVVIVDPPNQPPIVLAGDPQTITTPVLTATLQGQVYDDGLPLDGGLTWRWSGPRGVTFTNPSQISTQVTFPRPGVYTLTLTASDSQLTAAAQTRVTVISDNVAPTVLVGPAQTITLPARSVTLSGSVSDDGKPLGGTPWTRWAVIGGPPATIANPRALQTVATLSDPGVYLFKLTASDGELSSSNTLQVTLAAPSGALPVVALTSPDDGSAITAPTSIQGTVDSGAWTLEYSRDGGNDQASWVAFASGIGVASGVLASFDPMMLLNGSYVIRLSSTSAGGTASAQLGVVVQKNLKIGNVALAFTDATVALGLPITLVRSYDSRDTTQGDFGAGWNLSLRNVRVEKTVPIGKFWKETQEGYFAFPSYCLKPTKANVVSITFPNGKVYRFSVETSPGCQPLAPIDSPQIALTPLPGTLGKLAIADADPVAFVRLNGGIPGPVQLTDTDGFGIYDPKEFQLTTEDGTVFLVRQFVGVEAITDRNGNTLTIAPDGVRSSSGIGTFFVRDAAGRISQIADPNGNSLFYDYDQDGNLIRFTDRTGAITSFGYDAFHRLLSITDARGKQVLTETYDAAGRLATTADVASHTVTMTHDLAAHRETVTDALNHSTTYEYDIDGNVVHVIDALSHETFSIYDANDNKLSETDALGHTTRWTYDASNNKTSETEPLGHVTKWTYDAFGNVLTTEDPLHHVTTSTRESGIVCGHASPTGNLLATQDARGQTTTYAYDCNGKLLSQTDARGGVTTYAFDGAGRLLSTRNALSQTSSYTYDANGNQTSETRGGFTTTYEYDPSGRRTKVTSADGTFTRTVYNEISKPKSTFDQLNRETKYAYDDQGRLTTTIYPDGPASSTTYDEVGRRKTSTDRGGRTTSYGYDAVGRLTTTTFPNLSSRTTEYDEAGRVKRSLDELAHPTSYGYDDAGRRTSVTDALGKSTVFAYDDAGNQISVTDPNLNQLQYGYDELNRQRTVTYPDTTHETTEYDAQGNRSARVDQAGIRTEYGYDLLGRLTSVTNKSVNGVDLVTRYGYDELGNRISQTDGNAHTTKFGYDSLGCRISRTLPLGQVEAFTYYADGQLKTRTDFNGHTTTYAYDDAGRLSTRTPDAFFASEIPVTFTYWPSGRRKTMSDSTGLTSYAYDLRDRLLTKSTPEGSLTYTYDLAGNRKTVQSDSGAYDVRYGYDELNRLHSVTDNIAGGGTTTYRYDAGGRLIAYDYPNTISTSFAYDSLNRVQSMKIGSAPGTANEQLVASYAYTFLATGNRHTVTELSGRNVTWTYDNLWRLTNETIAGSAGANGSIAYVYDSVGNRLSRTSSVSGIPNQTSSYDDNDRLLADGWDSNGNTLTSSGNQYAYDSENRLLSLNSNQAHYVYDADGQLVLRTVGGVTTTYVIDDQSPNGYTQVAEERVSGASIKSYVYGPQRISMRDASGLHYYGSDAHSGVRVLMNAAGTVTDTWDYDAFGNVITRTGTTANDFTYRGERLDSILLMSALGPRMLASTHGRFTTSDTYEPSIFNPTSFNRYTYVENDPIQKIDPTGLKSSIVYGIAVHAKIFANWVPLGRNRVPDMSISWLVCDGDTARIINGVPCKVPWTEGGWRRPDMADPITFDVFEIKPEGSEAEGKQQLTEYIDLLRYHDLLKRNWHRGNNYLPSVGPPPIAFTSIMDGGVKIRIDDPVDGLIVYQVDNDQLREWALRGLRNLGFGVTPLGPAPTPIPLVP